MTDLKAEIIAEARTWIGTPYRHQASLRGVGCDCLGLLRGVFVAIYGVTPEEPPAYSADWAEAGTSERMIEAARRHLIEIDPEAAEAGDVLIFRWRPRHIAKHVGIVGPDGSLIHAYQAAGEVSEGPMPEDWRRRIAAAFRFPPRSVEEF